MVRLALRSALSDRAADGKVIVVDEWSFGDVPRTSDARRALEALGIEGRALVVLHPDQVTEWKSFRNLPSVHLIEAGQLNAYDVLVSDVVVFTRDTLPSSGAGGAGLARRAAPAESKPAPAKAKAAPAPKAKPAADTAKPPADTTKKKVVKKKADPGEGTDS
jgi:large subunit ribosomal protein L4